MPTRVFHDDFEDGTTDKWEKDPTRPKAQAIQTAADGGGPHSGSWFMSANWFVDDFESVKLDGWDVDQFAYQEFFIRLWWRIDADVDDASGAKFARFGGIFGSSSPFAATFSRDEEAGGGGGFNAHHTWRVAGEMVDNHWSPMSFQDRAWHKLEIYCKKPTNLDGTGTDGVLKFWFDGVLMPGYPVVGDTWNDGHPEPVIFMPSNWSQNVGWEHDGVNHLYTDDVEIFTDSANGEPAVGSMDDATIQVDPGPTGAPTITSPRAAAGVENVSFSYQISATGNPTAFDATDRPSGLNVNTTTGVIDGTPTASPQSRGDYIVPISATNAEGTGDAPLATVIRRPLAASGSEVKPAAVGAAPDGGHPLTTDLVISWLFNEGDDPSPVTTLVNGGAGGTTYDLTVDYSDAGNYAWEANAGNPSTYDLQVATTATGEIPVTLANPLSLGTTWTFEVLFTDGPTEGNSVGAFAHNGSDLIIGRSFASFVVRPNLVYESASHTGGQDHAFGQTYHVVFSVDAGTITFYVNGVAQTSTFTDVPSWTIDRLFTNTAGAHSNSLVAKIHYIRIWNNRALTGAEIQDLFATPYDMYAAVSSAPVIESALTANATEGEPFVYGIVADPLPDSYDAFAALPAGLQVDTDLGIIFGTPEAGTNGNHNVTIEATNSVGTDSQTLVITVGTVPAITSLLDAEGREGEAFTYQIEATNSPTSFDALGLPTGLSVNTTTGLIDGTPTANGLFVVAISATNASGTDQENLQLNIQPPLVAPTITSPLTATGGVGEPFFYAIEVNEVEVDTFSAAPLPAGLQLDAEAGEISGTPTAAGETNTVIRAENAAGFDEEVLEVTIGPLPADVPSVTSALVAGGVVGQSFNYQITATEAPFEFFAVGLPGGLTLNSGTGLITGIPTAEGFFNVLLTAENGAGIGPQAILALTIEPAEEPEPGPVFVPPYGTTLEQTRGEFLDEFLMFVGELGDEDARDVAERLLNRVIVSIWQQRTWQQFILPTPHIVRTVSGARRYPLPSYFGRVSTKDGRVRNLTRRQEIYPAQREDLQTLFPGIGTSAETARPPLYYVIQSTQGTPNQPDPAGERLELVSDSPSDNGIRVVVAGYGPLQQEQRVSITLTGTTPIAAGLDTWRSVDTFAKAVPASGVTKPPEFHSSHGTVTLRVAPDGRTLGKLAPRESSRKVHLIEFYPTPVGGHEIAVPIYRVPSGLIHQADPLPLGWRDAIFEEMLIQYRVNTGELALDGDTDRIPRPKLHDLITFDNLSRPRPRVRPYDGGWGGR